MLPVVLRILDALSNSSLADDLKFFKKPLQKRLALTDQQTSAVNFAEMKLVIENEMKHLATECRVKRHLYGSTIEDTDEVKTEDDNTGEIKTQEVKTQEIKTQKNIIPVTPEKGVHDYKAITALRKVLTTLHIKNPTITEDDEYLYLDIFSDNPKAILTLGCVLYSSDKRKGFYVFRFEKSALEASYDRYEQVKKTAVEMPIDKDMIASVADALDVSDNELEGSEDSHSVDYDNQDKVIEVKIDCMGVVMPEVKEHKGPKDKKPLFNLGDRYLIRVNGKQVEAVLSGISDTTLLFEWKNGPEQCMRWIDPKSNDIVKRLN